MRAETIEALEQLNAAFYVRAADSFSETRSRPWAGFARIVDDLPAVERPLRVLDVGCGNGRFFGALEAGARLFTGLGIEPSEPLRSHAAQRYPRHRFVDGGLPILSTLPQSSEEKDRFDLVVAFAVLHHVPSRARRCASLRALADQVAMNGRLVVTVWRLDQPRLKKLVVPWERVATVDPTDLEPGDRLLRWGPDPEALRYAHAIGSDEVGLWTSATGLRCIDRFVSDGRTGDLNEYIVFSRDPDDVHSPTLNRKR